MSDTKYVIRYKKGEHSTLEALQEAICNSTVYMVREAQWVASWGTHETE